MAWVIIMSVLFLMVATMIVNATVAGLQRSRAQEETLLVTQRVDSGVAEAIETLTAVGSLPGTYDTAETKCQTLHNRSVCYRYWATAIPGDASDPVRYNLLVHAWVDRDRDGQPPTNGTVRSTRVPIEAITYQTQNGQKPTVDNTYGFVAYSATPLGLFSNAMHAFGNVTLNGPETTIGSYNSATGATGIKVGVVSADGTVSYGRDTGADRTVLFGGASSAGNFTERCTGEACGEADVRVVPDTHQTPTPDSIKWMDNVACTATFNGDWRASEQRGELPAQTTCIQGNLVIDQPTTRLGSSATLYVYGNVIIKQSLNAPSGGQAQPGKVQIYSKGTIVDLSSTEATEQGSAIAAMLYAPMATCGNNTSGNAKVSYFGSLVCGTISISGPWSHQFDQAGASGLTDPVPGAKKAWSAGPAQNTDEGSFRSPEGWDANTCIVPAPAGAELYYKLDERTGTLARDSSGKAHDASWTTPTRPAGLCGGGAQITTAGTVTLPSGVSGAASLTAGGAIEYWAKDANGVIFDGAGVKVEHVRTTRNVYVTVGGTKVKFPFTVQNYGEWHLYTVAYNQSGGVRLYVDGKSKAVGTTGILKASGTGAVTIGQGTAGYVDEVAYLPKLPTATEVSKRWTMWNSEVTFAPSDPGTPFTAPLVLEDNGTIASRLAMKWRAASGTLPATGTPTASYMIKRSTTETGTYTDYAAVAIGTTTFTQTNPPVGKFFYKVCATYNGDERCSLVIELTAITIPTTPVVKAGTPSTNSVAFSWAAVPYAATYEVQSRVNGGAWSGTSVQTTTSKTVTSTVQGNKLELRVRAVNAAGASGWGSASATLTVTDHGTATGWNASASFPYFYVRLTGVACGPGLTHQMQYSDRALWYNGAAAGWNGYTGWITQDYDGAVHGQSAYSTSVIGQVDAYAQIKMNVRCINATTGVASAPWGEHGPINLEHGISVPWGTYVTIPSYRTAGWGAGCQTGSYPVYMYEKRGGAFEVTYGWTTAQTYANTGRAWGNGTQYVTAFCRVDYRGDSAPSYASSGY